jgi:hypothetical protein
VTALERRLAKVEDALSPTEAVVRWLEEAKRHESYAIYSERLKDRPAENPFSMLPAIVAKWAGYGERGNDRAITERVERAVRSLLVRVFLVERMNQWLSVGAQADSNQLDLLQMLEPLVLSGRLDLETESRWVEHSGRLVDEARIWQEGAERMGERYLAGASPLFPDVAAYLAELRQYAEELLQHYNAAVAKPRGRKPKGAVVDLTLIDQHVASLVESHTAELVRLARTDAEVFLGERDHQLSIPRLIGRGE